MKKLMMAAVLALTVGVPTVAMACDGAEHSAAVEPKSVSPTELASLTKEKKATAVDANGEKTRSENGVVPGAILLTSSSQFDPAKELPANKDANLVFYCASEKCGASHTAAKRAAEAGYTNVAVMPAGIKGWKKAGQPTSKPNS